MEFFQQYYDAIFRGMVIAGGVISFIIYLRTEISNLRSDVTQIKDHQKMLMDSIKSLNTILTQIAVQETRMNMLEKDIDELRHGQGFINK